MSRPPPAQTAAANIPIEENFAIRIPLHSRADYIWSRNGSERPTIYGADTARICRFSSDLESPKFRAIELLDVTMPQPVEFRIRGLGLRGWLMILVSVSVALAIVVAIAVVAVGVFLFLLPLLAVVAIFYYLFGRTKFRPRNSNGPVIIDGEFHIVDASEIERKPPPQN